VPKEIITRLNHEVVKLMKTQEARDRMAGLGADVVAGTPEQFAEVIRVETAKWAKLVRALNIRME
jgi:tripartite-type tricarboxylate transporter receptor subunit TctC